MNSWVNELKAVWTEGTGQDSEIVLSTRTRLARNIKEYSFPSKLAKIDSELLLEKTRLLTESSEDLRFLELNKLSEEERTVLVEKHLMSPELANNYTASALIIAENGYCSIMVNEEDHFRIQCFSSGLETEKLMKEADAIDDWLESEFDFAYDEKWGYLTACPTNLGSGLRVSIMMHLPGLTITGQAGRIFSSLQQYGIAIRGLYGENSEAEGSFFQISNQLSMGRSEKEIYTNIFEIGQKIIFQEQAARDYLKDNLYVQTADRAFRAKGLLGNAYTMSSQEALGLISDLRLGVALGIIEDITLQKCNELLLLSQPGSIQLAYNTQMQPQERDLRRAELLKNWLIENKKNGGNANV